jgi:hypothetical protein
VGNGSGVSRGDRNRNARLERLRALVPVENAIGGIDLADRKQMVVVTDHDSKVLARKTFRCRAGGTRDGVGLGRRPGRREGVRRRQRVVRADRAPVAGAGPVGRGPGHAVRVRAAVGRYRGARKT